MKNITPSFINKLDKFLVKASKDTYAGGGEYEKIPERPGFRELVYKEGDFHYRDSYTGFYRSRGMELVRYKNKPLWTALYGGGMTKGNQKLAGQAFSFLKKAMSNKSSKLRSFRGPKSMKDGDWEYRYEQKGDINEFSGFEEILFKGNVVFFHRIIGGIIKHE